MSCFSSLCSLVTSCWDCAKEMVTLEVNLLTPEEVKILLSYSKYLIGGSFQAEELRLRRTIWNLPSSQDARWQDHAKTVAEVANENAVLRVAENFPNW